MRKWLLSIGIVSCLPLGGLAEKPDLWFPVGEQLTYAISWGPWTVGYSTIWTEWIREDGRDLLAIRVRTRSTSILNKLFPVDDFLESIVDPVTFLPLRFRKNLSEGRYRLREVTTFDHQKKMAHWQHLLRDSHEDFAIDADTRDLLSFMFFMRMQAWDEHKGYFFRVMADEKLYDLYVMARGYEDINLPRFGKVRSLKMVPEAAFHGLFVRVGRLEVWVSDDDRCLLTKATAIVPFPIGTIRVMLNKVEGPGDDFWSDMMAK
ncbi:MAG: DUF3108 domain-containing protein [Verrucomicrobia bacterium]|nr:DUF3108 domain-containing protein [Verrucomicrobiota bacterium]MBU4289654.1 DUF3108 domain-containing protein [Verrucomicrobiota bacterium]MBU4430092.1 DUF3108 domain-containing protein [Verrucomicrobiota bacterium]MCG2681352.1 DUF3108 domain-containing protein [Kiritimatiellia bacterium]